MTETEKKARELFSSGHNCAQAVFYAVCESKGLDMNTAFMIASPFGGGMGGTRNTCGAVSGMMLAAGWLWGYTDARADPASKVRTYDVAKELIEAFEKSNGSIICRELLGLVTPPSGPLPKKKPCQELVAEAVRLIESAAENR